MLFKILSISLFISILVSIQALGATRNVEDERKALDKYKDSQVVWQEKNNIVDQIAMYPPEKNPNDNLIMIYYYVFLKDGVSLKDGVKKPTFTLDSRSPANNYNKKSKIVFSGPQKYEETIEKKQVVIFEVDLGDIKIPPFLGSIQNKLTINSDEKKRIQFDGPDIEVNYRFKTSNFEDNKTCDEKNEFVEKYSVDVRAKIPISTKLAIMEKIDPENFYQKEEINAPKPYENDEAEYIKLNWTGLEAYDCDCTIVPTTLPQQ